MVALEGQGQDELFDILAGSERPSGGELAVDGEPVTFRHPGDAIRAGVVYVAADRADALLMQRSVRENIALPLHAQLRKWGLIDLSGEGTMVDGAVETLQIDARAGNEVRRLSGGNQQKVTIARWVARGVHVMLCFDPTRGIDIRTKNQIYVLLRDLAEAGAAILLYTSELKEVELVCDRAIVIFGGRDRRASCTAERGRRGRAPAGRVQPACRLGPARGRAAETVASDGGRPPRRRRRSGTTRPTAPRPRDGGRLVSAAAAPDRRSPGPAPASMLVARPPRQRVDARPARDPDRRCSCSRRRSSRATVPIPLQGLATSILPLALAAVAQAIVVISGGIDLSIGSMMALTSVVSATMMKGQSDEFAIVVVVARARARHRCSGAVNGGLVIVTRVPDIVVTLAMGFVWAGFALLVRNSPGGGAAKWLKDLVVGPLGNEWIPKAFVVLIVIVAVIWIPVRRSRLGLTIYAIGSNRLAAFRSGVPVNRTTIAPTRCAACSRPSRGCR